MPCKGYEVAQNITDAVIAAKKFLEQAQQRAKSYADKSHRDVNFSVGDKVLISTKNLKLKVRKDTKLLPKYVGPVTVLKCIGSIAYVVELPPQWRVHNVFHVSLLRKYTQRGEEGHVAAPPAAWLADEPLYEVDSILDHTQRPATRKTRRTRYITKFLIKWFGYDHLHNSWEPETNLLNCKDVLAEYWHKVNAKLSRWLRGISAIRYDYPRIQRDHGVRFYSPGGFYLLHGRETCPEDVAF